MVYFQNLSTFFDTNSNAICFGVERGNISDGYLVLARFDPRPTPTTGGVQFNLVSK